MKYNVCKKGTSTNVVVSRVRLVHLDYPYSNCITDTNINASDSKHYRITKSLNITYSQRICFDVFRQVEIVISNCKCNHPKLPIVSSITIAICKTVSELDCGERFLTNTVLFPSVTRLIFDLKPTLHIIRQSFIPTF